MRLLRGSGEVQTSQSQPMMGTPTEVAVPRNIRRVLKEKKMVWGDLGIKFERGALIWFEFFSDRRASDPFSHDLADIER